MRRFEIIIPTYNRTEYLERILSYYDKFHGDYRIVVADSSFDKNKQKNKRIINSFKNLDILHLSDFDKDIEFSHKISQATKHVDAKYCVFCADDDFITISGINKSIEFMEKNEDFSCTSGTYINFRVKDKKFFWKYGRACESVTSDDPIQRVLENFRRYNQTFYAVNKTKVLQKILDENSKYTDDDRFGEILPSMLSIIQGKMKKIDVLYAARHILDDSGGRTSKKIQDFVHEGTYKEKYERFRTCLAKHLAEVAEIDYKKAEKTIDKGWKLYTKKHKGYAIPKINYYLKKMPMPKTLDKKLRRMYRAIRKNKKVAKTTGFNPSANISEKYKPEFEVIKNHVLEKTR